MKKLTNCVCIALFLMCCIAGNAQDNSIPLNDPDLKKPKLFKDLPSKMNLKVTEMESLFRLKMGALISFHVTDEMLLEGTVVSKAEDDQVKSVVIRSSNRPGAIFTFTKTKGRDGKDEYVGRMLSRHNGDAYEIVKENGQYVLIKKDLYDLINE